jgi:carbonic anhydrase
VSDVLTELRAGIRKFRTEVYPKNKATYLKAVSEPQRPHALFITCADSRLDPELITQSGTGDIFVTRNIGNLVPAYGEMMGGVSAVVEYAVTGLKVQHVVICGHSDCGAMKALVRPESLTEMPAVRNWMNNAAAAMSVAKSMANKVRETAHRGECSAAVATSANPSFGSRSDGARRTDDFRVGIRHR